MAKLDIAEKRVHRMAVSHCAWWTGHRCAGLHTPSRHGERIVLRLLDRSSVQLDMTSLGMTESIRQHISNLLLKPHGILLVTGPTGSGKSPRFTLA